MKNIDKHAALSSSDIRDFLAKQIGDGYEGEVEHIKGRIVVLQKELEIAKRSQAVLDLMKGRGWEQFDVSNDIEDYKYDEYFPFVGTKEELVEWHIKLK